MPSSRLSASSSHEPSSVGAAFARLNREEGGGAWCPQGPVDATSREYLEVDLAGEDGQPMEITSILTQGRFGGGHGVEFAEYFRLEFHRTSMPSSISRGAASFVRYRNRSGSEVFPGNVNPYGVAATRLDPPIVADKLRVVPVSNHPRTVCMRIELLGCNHTSEGTFE